jgi:hypothetical protein
MPKKYYVLNAALFGAQIHHSSELILVPLRMRRSSLISKGGVV